MPEWPASPPVEGLLAECHRRGLKTTKMGSLRSQPGSRHWHVRKPGHDGVLEVTAWKDEVRLKVAQNRDGGWATAAAEELAEFRPGRS